jgi:hypothetical protein
LRVAAYQGDVFQVCILALFGVLSINRCCLSAEPVNRMDEAATPRYDRDLPAESWKMHYIGLGYSLERIPRFAPGCQAAYDDKCLKSPSP